MPDNISKPWSLSEVRCLAGSKADERPISFLVDESEIEVF